MLINLRLKCKVCYNYICTSYEVSNVQIVHPYAYFYRLVLARLSRILNDSKICRAEVRFGHYFFKSSCLEDFKRLTYWKNKVLT